MKTRGTHIILWVAIALFVVAMGCSKQEEPKGQAASTAETKAGPVVDAATAGKVAGTVAFSGDAPEMTIIDVSSEEVCHHSSESEPVYTENVIVNANGTLKNTFVYVKEGLEGMDFAAPADAVVIDQVGCTYKPHVFGIQAKQPLLIKNSDEGVLHNIHSLSKKGNGFNFGMPKVMESTKQFKRAEIMIRIKCDVHGWMNAYAGVLDHPYYAVTGDDGSFELAPLPPGDYVIESWHEEYGAQTQNVTVTQQETTEITFTFKPAS